MKTYAVGGAIRDALMGLPIHDIDYVVVGSSVQEMLAKGFRPVGKDFPVFLHPTTQAEYALARTERKTGKGYKGFHFYADPSVTLEQDLQRRDLTINAMAQEVDADGNLVDPFWIHITVSKTWHPKYFVTYLMLLQKTRCVCCGLRVLQHVFQNLLLQMKQCSRYRQSFMQVN